MDTFSVLALVFLVSSIISYYFMEEGIKKIQKQQLLVQREVQKRLRVAFIFSLIPVANSVYAIMCVVGFMRGSISKK